MAKRISCRVVMSAPLGKSIDALRHKSPSNNKRHKAGDIVTAGAVNYIQQLGITRVFIDNSSLGQFLDCYA